MHINRLIRYSEGYILARFSRFIFVPLVVGILLDECKGVCRARLNRALEGFWVAERVYISRPTQRMR
jgi:hypothetical protein